jgi:hypothetical protein
MLADVELRVSSPVLVGRSGQLSALDACAVPKSRTLALSWRFRCSSGRSPVLADHAVDDVGAHDPGGHIDWLAGLVQRRSLFPRLVRPMTVDRFTDRRTKILALTC